MLSCAAKLLLSSPSRQVLSLICPALKDFGSVQTIPWKSGGQSICLLLALAGTGGPVMHRSFPNAFFTPWLHAYGARRAPNRQFSSAQVLARKGTTVAAASGTTLKT